MSSDLTPPVMGGKIVMKNLPIHTRFAELLVLFLVFASLSAQAQRSLTLERLTPAGTWENIDGGFLNFGSVDCHVSASLTCRFRNSGTERFNGAGVSLREFDPELELIVPEYDFFVDPGDIVEFEVIYTPRERSLNQFLELNGSYRVNGNTVTTNYAQATITGNGLCAEPQVLFEGAEVDFFSVPHPFEQNHFGILRPNDERIVKTFELYNVPGPDAVPLVITFPRISGEHEDEFELIGLENTQTIPVGGSLGFDIAFEPASLGEKKANFEFFANGVGRLEWLVRLRGAGGLPEITVEEATTDTLVGNGALLPPPEFVIEAVDGSSSTKLFTIRNPGTGPLTINSISVGGDFAFQGFTVTGITLPHAIDPSDSETFFIEFTPTRTNFQVATVTISNDSPDDSPFTFAVGGRIRGPEMDVSGKPNNAIAYRAIEDESTDPLFNNGTDFGSAEVGSQVFRTYRIDNPGDEDLILTPRFGLGGVQPLIYGPNADAFTASSSLPDESGESIVIAPGEFYEFSIFFDPAPGLQEATFGINSNDSNENSYRFAIQGTGIVQTEPDIDIFGINDLDKEIRILDGDLDPDQEVTQFGNGALSSRFTRNYRVTNSGTDTLTIVKATSSLDDFIISALPKTLAPGTSADFEITFTPEETGERQSIISIQSDDPDAEGSFLFAVTGTGSNVGERPYAINAFEISGEDAQMQLTLVPDNSYRLTYSTSLGKNWLVVPGYESLSSVSGILTITIPGVATLNKELPAPQPSLFFRLEEH